MIKIPVLFKKVYISSHQGIFFAVVENWDGKKWYMIKISETGAVSIIGFKPKEFVLYGGRLELIIHIKNEELFLCKEEMESMKISDKNGVYRSSVVDLLRKRKAFQTALFALDNILSEESEIDYMIDYAFIHLPLFDELEDLSIQRIDELQKTEQLNIKSIEHYLKKEIPLKQEAILEYALEQAMKQKKRVKLRIIF